MRPTKPSAVRIVNSIPSSLHVWVTRARRAILIFIRVHITYSSNYSTYHPCILHLLDLSCARRNRSWPNRTNLDHVHPIHGNLDHLAHNWAHHVHLNWMRRYLYKQNKLLIFIRQFIVVFTCN